MKNKIKFPQVKLKIPMFFLVLIFSINAYSNKANNTNHIQSIVLGSGCFWGAEKGYEQLDGVIDAVSGYSDGRGVEPNYKSIIKYKNKFNENNLHIVQKFNTPTNKFNSSNNSINSLIQ